MAAGGAAVHLHRERDRHPTANAGPAEARRIVRGQDLACDMLEVGAALAFAIALTASAAAGPAAERRTGSAAAARWRRVGAHSDNRLNRRRRMRRLWPRRAAERLGRRLGRRGRAVRGFGRWSDRRRRWRGRRLGQRDFDQPLDGSGRVRELNAQSRQQDETQHQLNDHDRGKRISALPRPRRSCVLGISGHQTPALHAQR